MGHGNEGRVFPAFFYWVSGGHETSCFGKFGAGALASWIWDKGSCRLLKNGLKQEGP